MRRADRQTDRDTRYMPSIYACSLFLSISDSLSLCLFPSAGGDNPAEKLTNGNLLSEMKLLQLCKMAKMAERENVGKERWREGCVVWGPCRNRETLKYFSDKRCLHILPPLSFLSSCHFPLHVFVLSVCVCVCMCVCLFMCVFVFVIPPLLTK